ncbi:serine hydrolase [Allostreptomyces psammosilenae]|uniref:Beta-lactamase class A n=1 Tax=Allostreptomyces psammosilenae TaxID=1892865 RepID=A0A853A1U4_9ACTN|nr:serine hydrolase [Allostreptomyces psammosilenae]NYI04482.1 beta-lactamase class A [Allostreptomyces psammosilenae]
MTTRGVRWRMAGVVAVVGVIATGVGLVDTARVDQGGERLGGLASAGDVVSAVPSPSDPAAATASPTDPAAAPAPSPEPSTSTASGGSTAQRARLLETVVAAVTARAEGNVGVAVLDLATGRSATAGDDEHAFATASVAKVDILAALLLQAQQEGRELTAEEERLAAAMIQVSDNAAADALWRVIGGAEGLAEANERFGMTGTVPGADGHWGLTLTTPADQLALLRTVFAEDSVLEAESRARLQSLMGEIAEGQDWGVSAAAEGGDFALKNGWLPRSATGLWVVNSIGWVAVDGSDGLLVAVLSDGQLDQASGISLVEDVARAAVGVFR